MYSSCSLWIDKVKDVDTLSYIENDMNIAKRFYLFIASYRKFLETAKM